MLFRSRSFLADTGPAGPNTELNVDLRAKNERGNGELSTDEFVRLNEAGKQLEIWNLVFMQYDLQPDGSRKNLPKPSVDTGAGLDSYQRGHSKSYKEFRQTRMPERCAGPYSEREERSRLSKLGAGAS